jgi:hypothetical protein
MLIGSDMRELKSSITRSLCDQIFTEGVQEICDVEDEVRGRVLI